MTAFATDLEIFQSGVWVLRRGKGVEMKILGQLLNYSCYKHVFQVKIKPNEIHVHVSFLNVPLSLSLSLFSSVFKLVPLYLGGGGLNGRGVTSLNPQPPYHLHPHKHKSWIRQCLISWKSLHFTLLWTREKRVKSALERDVIQLIKNRKLFAL